MRNDRDSGRHGELEAELLRNLRLMTPEARSELIAMPAAYADLFPLRPVLRLVHPAAASSNLRGSPTPSM